MDVSDKPEITDEMIDAELVRQELNRRAGVLEVEGRVDARFSRWHVFTAVFWGVLAANFVTAIIAGVVLVVLTATASV